MGRATLGSTDVLKGAYFLADATREPLSHKCMEPICALQYLEPTVELGGALKDYGHGAHLAVTPSHAGTQGMHWSLLHGLGLPTRVGPEQSCVGDGIAWKFTAAAT